jgi:hypothetical protein
MYVNMLLRRGRFDIDIHCHVVSPVQANRGHVAEHPAAYVITLVSRDAVNWPEWRDEQPVMDPAYLQECLDAERLVSVTTSVNALGRPSVSRRAAQKPLGLTVRALHSSDRVY